MYHVPAILCGIAILLTAVSGKAEDAASEGKGQIDAKSFRCITEMTHVRQFYVDNVLGTHFLPPFAISRGNAEGAMWFDVLQLFRFAVTPLPAEVCIRRASS